MRSKFSILIIIALAVIVSAGQLFASEDLQFKLSEENNSSYLLHEKKLHSLDLDLQKQEKSATKNINAIADLTIPLEATQIIPSPDPFITVPPEEAETVITFDSSFPTSMNSFSDSSLSSFQVAGRNGKFEFYGSFNQYTRTQLASSIRTSFMPVMPAARHSLSANSLTENNTANLDSIVSLNTTYTIEAVYNFKPEFSGKVAYKKGSVDSFNVEEKVGVAGIVKTSENTEIKASYSGDLLRDTKTGKTEFKDNEVKTEFILKF